MPTKDLPDWAANYNNGSWDFKIRHVSSDFILCVEFENDKGVTWRTPLSLVNVASPSEVNDSLTRATTHIQTVTVPSQPVDWIVQYNETEFRKYQRYPQYIIDCVRGNTVKFSYKDREFEVADVDWSDIVNKPIEQMHSTVRSILKVAALRQLVNDNFPLTVNLNDSVKFKLTDRGHSILNAMPGHMRPNFKEGPDGMCEACLWMMFQAFGQHMIFGLQPPFEPTIEIVTRK